MSLKTNIGHNSSFIRNPNLIYNEIDGEMVILSIENGEYYTLNSVGSEIWNLLKTQHTFTQIINLLLETYDINKRECECDTMDYMEDLLENEIINCVNV